MPILPIKKKLTCDVKVLSWGVYAKYNTVCKLPDHSQLAFKAMKVTKHSQPLSDLKDLLKDLVSLVITQGTIMRRLRTRSPDIGRSRGQNLHTFVT